MALISPPQPEDGYVYWQGAPGSGGGGRWSTLNADLLGALDPDGWMPSSPEVVFGD